jgi:hypothetical protein
MFLFSPAMRTNAFENAALSLLIGKRITGT